MAFLSSNDADWRPDFNLVRRAAVDSQVGSETHVEGIRGGDQDRRQPGSSEADG